MTERFPKAFRLTKRAEFKRLQHKSKSFKGQLLYVDSLTDSNSPHTRIGITVTRKYGKAHDRNRCKRLIREAFRKLHSHLPPHLLLHVRPSKACLTATFASIQQDLAKFMQKMRARPSKSA
ncbi:MAG: ribonuclease P protein component [Chlamydiia bacterium]|nr:ribonuclease P protein component [Chlamydiia bacterium]